MAKRILGVIADIVNEEKVAKWQGDLGTSFIILTDENEFNLECMKLYNIKYPNNNNTTVIENFARKLRNYYQCSKKNVTIKKHYVEVLKVLAQNNAVDNLEKQIPVEDTNFNFMVTEILENLGSDINFNDNTYRAIIGCSGDETINNNKIQQWGYNEFGCLVYNLVQSRPGLHMSVRLFLRDDEVLRHFVRKDKFIIRLGTEPSTITILFAMRDSNPNLNATITNFCKIKIRVQHQNTEFGNILVYALEDNSKSSYDIFDLLRQLQFPVLSLLQSDFVTVESYLDPNNFINYLGLSTTAPTDYQSASNFQIPYIQAK